MNSEDQAKAYARAKAYKQEIPNTGIYYLEHLQGPDGAHFTLFATEAHCADDINRAKSTCRHLWDVTGFTIVRVKTPWPELLHLKPIAQEGMVDLMRRQNNDLGLRIADLERERDRLKRENEALLASLEKAGR